MVNLRVTPDIALKKIQQIPHKNCHYAVSNCWKVNEDGSVRPESVLWLFCWAATGQGNRNARDAARKVFNEIFTHRCFDGKITFYTWFEHKVDLEYARKHRYSIVSEDELDALLCNSQDESK